MKYLNQLIVAIVAALALWTFWPKDKPIVGESVALPPAGEVRTVEKVVVKPRVVYVYQDRVKAALDLPTQVVDDTAKKVTATGKLDAEERPYTMTAVLDTQTGESQVFARPDPLPWIAPGRHGAVGVAYGLKNGNPGARLYANHELLRVKKLNMGAMSTLDQDGDWFAGGYVEYRF